MYGCVCVHGLMKGQSKGALWYRKSAGKHLSKCIHSLLRNTAEHVCVVDIEGSICWPTTSASFPEYCCTSPT